MKAHIGKTLSNHENEKILMIFRMLKHDLNLPEFLDTLVYFLL